MAPNGGHGDGRRRWLRLVALPCVLSAPWVPFARAGEPVWQQRSDTGALRVRIEPQKRLRLGEYIGCRLEVTGLDGKPVEASVTVRGGMPAHGHGLPSALELRRTGVGVYTLEGLMFNMPGRWTVIVDLRTAAGGSDRATFAVDVPA